MCAWGVSSVVAACEVCVCVCVCVFGKQSTRVYSIGVAGYIYSILQNLENIKFRLGLDAEGRRVGRVVCACAKAGVRAHDRFVGLRWV